MSTLRFNTWQNTGGTAATTASEVSAYSFTEPGLVHISRTTIGTAVSSVTVTDAFSSTFDNYRIIISGVYSSTTSGARITLGSATANYYFVRRYYGSGGAQGFYTGNPTSYWEVGWSDTTDNFSASIDICNPYRAGRTSYHGVFHGLQFTGYMGGSQTDSTSFTAFTFQQASGTISNGTIDVYGYAKA